LFRLCSHGETAQWSDALDNLRHSTNNESRFALAIVAWDVHVIENHLDPHGVLIHETPTRAGIVQNIVDPLRAANNPYEPQAVEEWKIACWQGNGSRLVERNNALDNLYNFADSVAAGSGFLLHVGRIRPHPASHCPRGPSHPTHYRKKAGVVNYDLVRNFERQIDSVHSNAGRMKNSSR
jgi:hypothetical protein